MRCAAALAILLAASGCQPPCRVGVVVPESGEASVYGASVKSGVKLAFDEATSSGRAPRGLEVIYRDSGSDPTRAASACEALDEGGALVVIGGVTSAEAKVMLPVADRDGRVLISPSASAPDLARRSPFFFRVYPSDELEGARAADLLVSARGVRAVLILQEDNDYTRGLLPVFVGELTSDGGRVVASVRVGESGWQAQVRDAIARRAPDGVYICGYGDAILASLRVVRSLGYRGTVCTTSAFSAGPLLARAASLAEGVFFPLASLDVKSTAEPVRSFVRHYRATYNLLPDIYAAHGYDAALAALAVLDRGRRPRADEIPGRLHSLEGTAGVMGPLVFDRDGNIERTLRNHWIHDGKVEDFEAYLERQRARAATGGGG